MLRLLFTLVALQVSSLSSLNAQVVLDQENIVVVTGSSFGTSVNSDSSPAQVVTTGIAGHLFQVDLGLSRRSTTTDPLFIDIASVSNGTPDFTEAGRLATVLFDANDVDLPTTFPNFNFEVDLSGFDLHFDAQEQFAILARSTSDGLGYSWFVSQPGLDTYSGGSVFNASNGDIGTDSHFRTFVAAVPEPDSVAILVWLSLGYYWRRHKPNLL